jgi:hypothetical protein
LGHKIFLIGMLKSQPGGTSRKSVPLELSANFQHCPLRSTLVRMAFFSCAIRLRLGQRDKLKKGDNPPHDCPFNGQVDLRAAFWHG